MMRPLTMKAREEARRSARAAMAKASSDATRKCVLAWKADLAREKRVRAMGAATRNSSGQDKMEIDQGKTPG